MANNICPNCNAPLFIAGSNFTSPIGSTDVYLIQKLVCRNPKCSNYCGVDLSNPRKIVGTTKSKVSEG